MFIILFPTSLGWEEENKMNFPWSILDSFQGQIGYWSSSLCLLRESLACQNRSPPWRLPISQCWLILCKLWPTGPNQGWWEWGWGWLSEVAVSSAVDTHDQWSRDPHRPILLPRFFGSTLPTPSVFLPSVEKEMDTERKVIPFIRSDGLDAINSGRVEWWSSGSGSAKT